MIQKNINLFDFSKIKSKHSFYISNCNSFNYNFSKNDKNKNVKTDSKYYIRKANMTIPSNEKFKEKKFRSDFFANYDNSFANFCGLNQKMFSEIYEGNQVIPTINQMGDVKVNINNIIHNINKFNDLIRPKFKSNFGNINEKKENYNKIRNNSKTIENKSINNIANIYKNRKKRKNLNFNIIIENDTKDDKNDKDKIINNNRKNIKALFYLKRK